jgi:predicted dehydrogenase
MAQAGNVRVASVGLGWWGGVLADAVVASEGIELVSCFARDPQRRTAFAEKYGIDAADDLDALLADDTIDGIVVATPHSVRAGLIEQAAAAGKHVFVEKPLALNSSDARRCVDAARQSGVVLQVGHNKRRQTGNRLAHQRLADGELGQLQMIETNISGPLSFKPDLPEWRQTREECPAGGMTAMGVHMLDTILYLGGPVARVYCRSTQVAGKLAIDDVTMVLLELQSGALAYLGTMLAVPTTSAVAIKGTDAAFWSEADGTRAFEQKRADPYRSEVSIEAIDTVKDEITEFARCIATGAQPETGGAQGALVVELFEAIVESAGSGTPVDLG